MRDNKGRFVKGNKHSEEVELKRVESIKESYASGKRIAWNKGLTRETDERVRKSTEKLIGLRKGVKFIEEHKRKISEALKGRKGHQAWNKGIPCSEETKEKIRKGNLGKIPINKGIPRPEIRGENNPAKRFEVREKIRKAKLSHYQNKEYKEKFLNSVRSEKTREKCRKSKIKYIEEIKLNGSPLYPTVGRYETQMLDALEESFGYTILRQHRVGGYFLDGYCPALHLAIEIDEKHHLNKKYKQSDIDRDNYLKTKFDCQILRINCH